MSKKKKQTGLRTKQTFLQRRQADGQEAHEKMFNITNYQRNANQNSMEELMLLDCGVGKDSWESLELQGDPASQS